MNGLVHSGLFVSVEAQRVDLSERQTGHRALRAFFRQFNGDDLRPFCHEALENRPADALARARDNGNPVASFMI